MMKDVTCKYSEAIVECEWLTGRIESPKRYTKLGQLHEKSFYEDGKMTLLEFYSENGH